MGLICIHLDFDIDPQKKITRCEVRGVQRPFETTSSTDPSVRKLDVQEILHKPGKVGRGSVLLKKGISKVTHRLKS